MKQEISLQTTPSPQDQSSEKEKPDFWKVIRELTPEDWIRHEILLYRRRPKLAIQGLGGFVAKFQYPFGIDDVKQAYGDYDWQAFLQKDGHVVTKIEFTIEAPPKPNRFATQNRPSPSPSDFSAPAVYESFASQIGGQRRSYPPSGRGPFPDNNVGGNKPVSALRATERYLDLVR